MNFGFQRKTDLALRALESLEAGGGRMSGANLAQSIGTTASFLPQVIAPLIDRGWVASERGPGGGYSLTDEVSGTTLFDVLEATEGPTVDGRCVLRDQRCPGNDSCPAHVVWADARDVLIAGLRTIPAVNAGELK